MYVEQPTCAICEKEIKGDDVVFAKLRYPTSKGITEITAYLNNEGVFICEDCYNKKGSA